MPPFAAVLPTSARLNPKRLEPCIVTLKASTSAISLSRPPSKPSLSPALSLSFPPSLVLPTSPSSTATSTSFPSSYLSFAPAASPPPPSTSMTSLSRPTSMASTPTSSSLRSSILDCFRATGPCLACLSHASLGLMGRAELDLQARVFKPGMIPFNGLCLARSGTIATRPCQARPDLCRTMAGPAQCPTLQPSVIVWCTGASICTVPSYGQSDPVPNSTTVCNCLVHMSFYLHRKNCSLHSPKFFLKKIIF